VPPLIYRKLRAELVSGYNVEYSSVGFALFFIGEYANMIFMACLASLLFLGGWNFAILNSIFNFSIYHNYLEFLFSFYILGIKTTLILFVFVWARAAFPRYRYDQLMNLGWKVFLPLSLAFVLFVSGVLFAIGGLPGF